MTAVKPRAAVGDSVPDHASPHFPLGFVPGTRYLAASGAVDNSNCTSPNNPCATLQHAVNQALNGDDLLLSAGSYTDYSTRTLGANVIQQTAFVDKDLSITGGYNAGDGYTTFQPITNSVTLDGQGNGRIFYLTSGIGDDLDIFGAVAHIGDDMGEGQHFAGECKGCLILLYQYPLYQFNRCGGCADVTIPRYGMGITVQNRRIGHIGGGRQGDCHT